MNIEYLYKDNFYLFKIDDFLSVEEYNQLKLNFPKINIKEVESESLIKTNLKHSINYGDDIYNKIILSNKVLSNFHNKIFHNDFKVSMFKKFYKKILKSRYEDKNIFLKLLLRFKRFDHNKNKKFYEKFLFSDIKTQIQYSWMFNKSKIVPHTDSRLKLLSLMLYFPDDDLDENNKKILGTTFYDSRQKSNLSNHLNDEKELNFKKNNRKILTLPFKEKNLYGFIKNNSTWHTVEPININNDFVRRSININLIIT